MWCESAMPSTVVGEGRAWKVPPPLRVNNQHPNAPRFSFLTSFFQGWPVTAGYTGPREVSWGGEENGDESMTSSPSRSSFDDKHSPNTTTILTAPAYLLLPGVDLSGLSEIERMRLRDGSSSPMPPGLEPGLQVSDKQELAKVENAAPTTPFGFDMFPLLGEDTAMEDMAFWTSFEPISAVPNTLPDVISSSFGPAATRLGRRKTVPGRRQPPAAPPVLDLLRRTSVKRSQDQRSPPSPPRERGLFCDCPLPDRPKRGQKLFLHRDIPTEILVEIFHYAVVWPPAKLPQCQHQLVPHRPLTRRATTGGARARPRFNQYAGPSTAASPLSAPLPKQEETVSDENSEEARKFGVKTLLRLESTCRKFQEILHHHGQYTDETYWRTAARSCWKWLPEKLSDVQGQNDASQTSWRNLIAVFMRSENSQFGTRKGGKGGVDCFGANKSCQHASTWEAEKNRRKEIERGGRRPRRLVLVCAQPGPDMFTVTPDEGLKGWTLSLSLRYGEEYLVHLDEYGRFGQAGKLPEDLRRSHNLGYFAPGIFENTKNRYRLVKVAAQNGLNPPRSTRSEGMEVQEIVRWDLSVIPELVADDKASVARCTSREGLLLCSLFAHRNPTDLDEFLDPPEDYRLFCVKSKIQEPGMFPDENTTGMSPKMRGKLPEKALMDDEGTVFCWRRDFEYHDQTAAASARGLHPVICNIQINSKHAVALIRWNETTPTSMQQLYDREFYVLDSLTGSVVKFLSFPNLFWDYRHHDMHREYNMMRVEKLNRLYNPKPDQTMGFGNRNTRIHGDAFILTDRSIVSGSHDYCNWLWPLDRETPPKGEYTADHNDGGIIEEPFDVLDDFYWNTTDAEAAANKKWEPRNERAGWWVNTPNQVLCFWHGTAISHDQTSFAVCRPGKMFVWNLDAINKVNGYTCLTRNGGDRQRWMGKPKKEVEKAALEGWNLCEDVMPEQGMWLLYEDGDTVFMDRDQLLEACGLEKVEWGFRREDFEFVDEDAGDGGRVVEEYAIVDDVMSDGEEDAMVEGNKSKRPRISGEHDMDMGVLWSEG